MPATALSVCASSIHGPHLHFPCKLYAWTTPALPAQALCTDRTCTVRASSIHWPHLHCPFKLHTWTTPALPAQALCTDHTCTVRSSSMHRPHLHCYLTLWHMLISRMLYLGWLLCCCYHVFFIVPWLLVNNSAQSHVADMGSSYQHIPNTHWLINWDLWG